MVFPPVTSPPWTITGGAERESILPGWEHLENGILKGYYQLHAQIWPIDWWPGPMGIEPGADFEIVTEVEVLYELPQTKTIDVYLQGPESCPDHKPVEVHQGINIIKTKCKMAGHIGSYVLTAASPDYTKMCQIHFKINRVEVNF